MKLNVRLRQIGLSFHNKPPGFKLNLFVRDADALLT